MVFAKSCSDINIRGQCYGYIHCFFFVLFVFIHVKFEGNNKYAKKVLSQPWNSLTLQISLSLREKHDKIVFTLQGYFGRSDNLLRSPRIFVSLDKRSECGCFLFKRLQRSEGILINRAAMGRARFIINRAAMGRARFIIYPWFNFFFFFFRCFVCD